MSLTQTELMEFDWTHRKYKEWKQLLEEVPRANYLQSLPFARAVRECDKKVTHLAVIRREGEQVGLMAVQEFRWGPLRLNSLFRGPLWFHENPPPSWFSEFATLFDLTFPRGFLKRRRWIPECALGPVVQETLRKTGFKPAHRSYETIWLDLRPSLADLREKLDKRWRNALSKGERQNLSVSMDRTGVTAKLFLHRYEQDKQEKGYSGRSKAFLREEISTALAYNEVFILWATQNGASVAAILVLLHGKSATYRVGWTTPEGRASNAHNVLLWRAIELLKELGHTALDLGGVEPSTAGGLTQFKRGLGGEVFSTVGVYR